MRKFDFTPPDDDVAVDTRKKKRKTQFLPTWWFRAWLIGCLGGVPIGTALTGGEPITGEDERGGGTLSDKSCPSSLLPWGGRLGRPTSLMIDMRGLSWRARRKHTRGSAPHTLLQLRCVFLTPFFLVLGTHLLNETPSVPKTNCHWRYKPGINIQTQWGLKTKFLKWKSWWKNNHFCQDLLHMLSVLW